jgi:hypothetical protein
MNRNRYLLIFIVLSTIVIVSSAAFVYISNGADEYMPDTLYVSCDMPLGQTSGSPNHTTSQGATYQVNYTLFSWGCPEQFEVTIENLTLIKYASFDSYPDGNFYWENISAWEPSIAQDTIFNYSLSLSQLTLQPHMSNSTIITLKWADNAPTGHYLISVNISKPEFLTEPSKYDGIPSVTVDILVRVYPKASQ